MEVKGVDTLFHQRVPPGDGCCLGPGTLNILHCSSCHFLFHSSLYNPNILQ